MPFRLANVAGRAVLVDGDDRYHDLEAASGGRFSSDPTAALRDVAGLHEVAAGLSADSAAGSIADVVLDAPVPAPQKVFGIGLNYLDHAAESSMEPPENPLVFTKFPSCLVGPTADVELRSDFCDYEGEVVVVIGPGGKDITAADAWNHVAGLSVGQDISDRKAQFAAKPPHFDLGKSFDTFGPIGPVVVSTDSFADLDAVAVTTLVNGEQRQHDTLASLLFSIPELIMYLSGITRLEPGDLIFTGTPSGVGAAKRLYLADGDEIVTIVDGVGTMTNRCRRVGDHALSRVAAD